MRRDHKSHTESPCRSVFTFILKFTFVLENCWSVFWRSSEQAYQIEKAIDVAWCKHCFYYPLNLGI